jgi:hypothetical protein
MFKLPKPINMGYSQSLNETKKTVTSLYRRSLKAIPLLTRQYRLPFSSEEMKEVIKWNFLQNAHLNDPHLIDIVVLQGENNLEEMIHSFQTRSHVMHYFLDSQEKQAQCMFIRCSFL